MPGRRHKPVEVLELTGAFRPDRHAARKAAPKSAEPVGDPPAHLPPEVAAAWCEFVQHAPAGVLTSGDRWFWSWPAGLWPVPARWDSRARKWATCAAASPS